VWVLEDTAQHGSKTGEPWAEACSFSLRMGVSKHVCVRACVCPGPFNGRLMEFLVLAKSHSPAPLQSAFCSAGPSPRRLCVQSACSVLPHVTPPHIDPSCFLMRSRNFRFAFSLRNTPRTCFSTLPFTSTFPQLPRYELPARRASGN
jgi:hypothetical protein